MPNGGSIREIIIEADRRQSARQDLRELVAARDLIYVLARRDLSARYRQSVLGVAWAVLQPLGTMLVFSVVFGRLLNMPTDGIPYPLFAFAGLLPWTFFSSAINAAGTSVINTPNLITKVYFPRLVIPAAALGAPAMDFIVSFGLMLLLVAGYRMIPSPGLIALLPLMVIAGLAAFGVGSFIAAMSVSYRDFRHLLPFLSSSWMFLTPVIYPASLIPEPWRGLLFINPMAGVVVGARSAWFGTPFDLQGIGISAVSALVLFIAGVAHFRSVERRFADLV